MASETDFSSHSVKETKVSNDLLHLKDTIVELLTDLDDFSVEFQQEPGESTKLHLTFGPKLDPLSNPAMPKKTVTNKLLLRGLPESVNEEFLEGFFEHTTRHGRGRVRNVVLDKAKHYAIIEFAEAEDVGDLLKQQPIEIHGITIEVEKLKTHLENAESLESTHVHMQVHLNGASLDEIANCEGCGKPFKRIFGGYRCRTCETSYCMYCINRIQHDPCHIFTDISPIKRRYLV